MAAALDTVFKTQIEEQTGGAVKVEVYHDGLLGDEAALCRASATALWTSPWWAPP